MKVVPSSVGGVDIFGMDSPEFEPALQALLGRAPRESIRAALPFSVVVQNRAARPVALMGVRFDMVGPRAKHYSVVHYADTLRNPEKAEFTQGKCRFICAEPAYTALLLEGQVAAHTRGRMNLENLRRMLQVRASLDCIGFVDGQFEGPDTQGALARFTHDRAVEAALVSEVSALRDAPLAEIEQVLFAAIEDAAERARRAVARKLLEGLAAGGRDELLARVAGHRLRIPLWRAGEP